MNSGCIKNCSFMQRIICAPQLLSVGERACNGWAVTSQMRADMMARDLAQSGQNNVDELEKRYLGTLPSLQTCAERVEMGLCGSGG